MCWPLRLVTPPPADEWVYAQAYTSATERHEAFAHWLHHYKHHWFDTAIGGPTASRVTYLSGQHT
ncbi:hypothetical protein [Nocardiopsis endophytica]|uniref:hypothetical protein n=1 Tax=Nocardiopsis endophytica TaxID=3018445 RepID=UPI0038CD8FD1